MSANPIVLKGGLYLDMTGEFVTFNKLEMPLNYVHAFLAIRKCRSERLMFKVLVLSHYVYLHIFMQLNPSCFIAGIVSLLLHSTEIKFKLC